MKKVLVIIMAAVLLVSSLTACDVKEKDIETETNELSESEATSNTQKETETETQTETESEEMKNDKSIKILEIGNSFGWDAVANIFPVLQSMGYTDIKIVATHYSACTIQQYLQFASRDRACFYEYTYDNSTTLIDRENIKLSEVLQSDDFDIITIMNHSNHSGLEEKFTDGKIEEFVQYIKDNSKNKDFKLFWYMPWAYREDFVDRDFANYYNNDQEKMYNAIVTNAKKYISENELFDGLIPAGTVVQNLRTSIFRDRLERDNFHMSLVLGRYAQSLLYACIVTGKTVADCKYYPVDSASGLNSDTVEVIRESVRNAINHPYEVTQSSYPFE